MREMREAQCVTASSRACDSARCVEYAVRAAVAAVRLSQEMPKQRFSSARRFKPWRFSPARQATGEASSL